MLRALLTKSFLRTAAVFVVPLLFVVPLVAVPSTTHAQTATGGGICPPSGFVCSLENNGKYGCSCKLNDPLTPIGQQFDPNKWTCTESVPIPCANPENTTTTGTGEPTTGNPAAAASSPAATSQDGGVCNFIPGIGKGDLGLCLSSIAGKVGASILLIFVSVFALLLGLIGGLLNWVLLITVFQYSTYFGNSEGMLIAWSVLRDLGNIILLFGFIFIGLQTILNLGHFSVGKALPRLIIFAILINFSLFVSEAIVDVSNIFSATFYTQAGKVDCTQSVNMVTCANNGLAGHVMKEAGLTGIFSIGNSFKDLWGAPNGVDMFFMYFCLLILITIMMVVFLAAIILFLIRSITLMILLVTSPLGFAAMAIPQLEEYSSMWWKKLISNAFFAPVFLLLILVGLKIMDGAGAIFNAGNASLSTAIRQGSTGTGGIFILYALIVGFMIAALMAAKNLGAMGASFATRSAGGMVLGSMGFWARRGGGAMAKSFAGAVANKTVRRRVRSIPLVGKMVDGAIGRNGYRGMYTAAKNLTKASFDPRTGVPGNLLKQTGLDFGKPGKTASHGLHGIEEKAKKEREEYAKALKRDGEQERTLQDIKKLIEAQLKIDTEELQKLDDAQRDARIPREVEIEAQRKRVNDATTPEARATEARILSSLTDSYTVLRQDQAKERAQTENRQKENISRLRGDEKRAKEAPQREYAEDLRDNKVFYPPFSVGRAADKEFAKKYLEDLDKSETQKLADELAANRKALKEAKDHGGGHGGDDKGGKGDGHAH